MAATIFHAATDGTDQLRYGVGPDVMAFAKARRETSEPEYLAYLRSRFSPRKQA